MGTSKGMSVNDLNSEMWAKLRDESLVQGPFSRATMIQKKNAVKEFITLWCVAIVGNEAAEIEITTWCVALAGSEAAELEATGGSPSSTLGKTCFGRYRSRAGRSLLRRLSHVYRSRG